MWKSACVGVYQLLNWKMHGETLKKKKATNPELHLSNIYQGLPNIKCPILFVLYYNFFF